MFDPSASVSVIEGIGPVLTGKLSVGGIATLLDLIRRPADLVHAAVASDASLAQVRAWKQMARLLQIDGLTPQTVEALVTGGVTSIDEVSHARFDSLRDLFAKAVADGRLKESPASNAVAAMIACATLLAATGNVTGRIAGPDGAGIAGAAVSVGTATTRSGADGCFRLVGVRLGGGLPPVIRHLDFLALVVNDPPVGLNPGIVKMGHFQLQRADDSSVVVISAPTRLSELDGDILPPIQGVPVRTVRLAATELRERDLLMLRALPEGNDDAELVSRFKSYERGEIVVNTLRLPQAQLPAGAKVKDHFVVQRGRLAPVKDEPRSVLAHKVSMRVRKQLGPIPRGLPAAELKRVLAERLHIAVTEFRKIAPRKRRVR